MIVSLLGISLVKELHRDPHYQALHPHAPEVAAVPGPVLSTEEAEEQAEEQVHERAADEAHVATLADFRQPIA